MVIVIVDSGLADGHKDCSNFVFPSFTKYMLGVILSAYRDFEERLELISNKKTAKEMVREVFLLKLGKITKSDIMEMCPNLSRSAVERALRELLKENIIIRHGKGPATFYTTF